MFDFDPKSKPINIRCLDEKSYPRNLGLMSERQSRFADAQGFSAKPGQVCMLPDSDGALDVVLFGLDPDHIEQVERLPKLLPKGVFVLEFPNSESPSPERLAHLWADGCYQFDLYKPRRALKARLALSTDLQHLGIEADILHNLRDWVNTPAGVMNTDAFAELIKQIAVEHHANFDEILGDALLDHNFPMIHAVGRAGQSPPRYCELRWNWDKTELPLLALVGKGVCFDTGGLNIKTGNFMRLMKKDMGGAAHALALAQLIMSARLPVRLQLGVPLVENNVAHNAFRPGDVLATRKGLMVEIDNTDAEGRLILSDALTKACENAPDLVIDFATLTGAARVALGPDLAPAYTDNSALRESLIHHGQKTGDPIWPMPLWMPYKRYLRSHISDIQNSGGRMAGSITAALFLKEFVEAAEWVHFDIWAWREACNGQPEGGYPCGIRAVWRYLQERFTI